MASENHPSYFKIYIMLLVLFVISVLGPEIAEIFDMKGASRLVLVLVTAFGIALVKAYYVLAYFMHLKFEKIYAPYLLLSMVALLFVFFFGTATDSMKSEGHNWEKLPVVLPEDKGFDHHGDAHGDSHGADDHAHDDHSGHAH